MKAATALSFVVTSLALASVAALGPRAHVMSTQLKPAAAYTAIAEVPIDLSADLTLSLARALSASPALSATMSAPFVSHIPAEALSNYHSAQEHGLGLRLVVKFVDGLAIRSSSPAHGSGHAEGVTTTVEASRTHAAEINRTLAAHRATVRPVLQGVGPEWEALVARAERLSGRAQPDLRAMMQVNVGTAASANELVALGQALSILPSVEFAEVEFTGMPPPGSAWKQATSPQDLMRDCPVPPPDRNGSAAGSGPTPDFTSLQRYSRGPDEGGFDAEVCCGCASIVFSSLVERVLQPRCFQRN